MHTQVSKQGDSIKTKENNRLIKESELKAGKQGDKH